jgi:hypothetical protein
MFLYFRSIVMLSNSDSNVSLYYCSSYIVTVVVGSYCSMNYLQVRE